MSNREYERGRREGRIEQRLHMTVRQLEQELEELKTWQQTVMTTIQPPQQTQQQPTDEQLTDEQPTGNEENPQPSSAQMEEAGSLTVEVQPPQPEESEVYQETPSLWERVRQPARDARNQRHEKRLQKRQKQRALLDRLGLKTLHHNSPPTTLTDE